MRIVLWILEDNGDLSFLLQAALSLVHPQLETRLFANGDEALQARGVPDIILVDINLPGRLTGLEVIEILRRRYPEVAVLFSSSLGSPPPACLGPRDRTLPKPFALAPLLRDVATMISQVPRLQVPPPHAPAHPSRFKHR